MATTPTSSGTMERILRLMSEKKASDVYPVSYTHLTLPTSDLV